MYKLIWKMISKLNIERKQKQRIFISVNVILYASIGLLLWYLFGAKRFGNNPTWFIGLVGYPMALLGFAGSIFALFKLDNSFYKRKIPLYLNISYAMKKP